MNLGSKPTKMALTAKWETALANERWETTRKSSKNAVPKRRTEVSIIHAGRSENGFRAKSNQISMTALNLSSLWAQQLFKEGNECGKGGFITIFWPIAQRSDNQFEKAIYH